MDFATPSPVEALDTVYRTESRRVLASLIRLLGDWNLAEEATNEAFAAAVEQWPQTGIPDNPRAWLISTGRFKAIDLLRDRQRLDASSQGVAARLDAIDRANAERRCHEIEDDRLRLIFTCCHPALALPIQVALTLREVCGLATDAIAAAFLTPTATMAQRIARGKAKIRDAGIPFDIPSRDELASRLDAVLAVVYLVFNEGYAASSGESLTRDDLSSEAIRLGELLCELLSHGEALGLLALMLLTESRRETRTDAAGDIVLLEDQDRSRWDARLIERGLELVDRALSSGEASAYALQAAIAAEHARAPSADATNWTAIVALYDALERVTPSAVVSLNRAVAVAFRAGPEVGLALVDGLLAGGQLADFHLAHAARADLCRRLGRVDEARASYRTALDLARQEPERRFLARRLAELG